MDYLFDKWDRLKNELRNKTKFLFLDYDGTLTPIVNTPHNAVISESTKELLNKLSISPLYKLAIISGRALNDVKRLVEVEGIIYVGNHGLEIDGPKLKFESPFSEELKSLMRRIKENLANNLSTIKGVFVEDKYLTVAVHYRLVEEEDVAKVKSIFDNVMQPHLVKKLEVSSGKKVFEVKPYIEWSKGEVVLWLLARQQFILENKSIFPIYIGDDVSDEDAFKVLKNKGLTIFVGRSNNSCAHYYLNNTDEVTDFLKLLSELT